MRHFLGVRVNRPVIIIESDDWGMWRGPRNIRNEIQKFGNTRIWSQDLLETTKELDDIYELLTSFSSRFERTPILTANFITANPDFQKTINENYSDLFLKPLHESNPELIAKYKEGIQKRVLFPGYHGRFHFNAEKYLKNLQTDTLSQEIFKAQFHGGLNNLSEFGWDLHSEYIHWGTGQVIPDLLLWIKQGFDEFEKMFGFLPQTTIPPQYVFNRQVINTFSSLGIASIQGTNMMQHKSKTGIKLQTNFPQGIVFNEKTVGLGRNVKFEPSRGIRDWTAKYALKKIDFLVKEKMPIVIDSHRINYTGSFADKGLEELYALLAGTERHDPLFLTSHELAASILNEGKYNDCFSGNPNNLNLGRNNYLFVTLRNQFS